LGLTYMGEVRRGTTFTDAHTCQLEMTHRKGEKKFAVGVRKRDRGTLRTSMKGSEKDLRCVKAGGV